MPLIPTAPPGAAGPPVDPAALLALLGGAGGPPPGLPPDQQDAAPQVDPQEAMRQWLQDTHTLIAVLPDPQDTAIMSQCLAQGTKIQQRMMQTGQQASTANQAVMQRLGGAGA